MSQSKRNNKGEKRNKQSPTIDWGLSQWFFSQQHKLHQSQSFDITNTSRMRQKERTPAFSCPLLWHVRFASRPCRPVQHCYNSATRTTKYSFFFHLQWKFCHFGNSHEHCGNCWCRRNLAASNPHVSTWPKQSHPKSTSSFVICRNPSGIHLWLSATCVLTVLSASSAVRAN